MKRSLHYLLIVVLIVLSACSTEPNRKYTQRFSYLENDKNGQVSIRDLVINVADGETVSFPSVPSIIYHYDSDGRILYTEYFTGWADYRFQWDYTITYDSSFTYYNSDSKDFRAVYCRKLILNDGEKEQLIQLGEAYPFDTIHFYEGLVYADGFSRIGVYSFIKTLRSASITQKENYSSVGWKLDYKGLCKNTGVSFDNIRIMEKDLQFIEYNEDNPGAYIDYEFKCYSGDDYVGTTDFFYSGKQLIMVVDSKEYYSLGSIDSALRNNPHFTVLWEPYPVVNFINGTNISQSSVAPNTCVQKPTDPSEDGFKFMWWSLNEAGEEFDFNTPITDDTSLYAVFEEL